MAEAAQMRIACGMLGTETTEKPFNHFDSHVSQRAPDIHRSCGSRRDAQTHFPTFSWFNLHPSMEEKVPFDQLPGGACLGHFVGPLASKMGLTSFESGLHRRTLQPAITEAILSYLKLVVS